MTVVEDWLPLSKPKQNRWRWLFIPASFLFPFVGIIAGIWYLPRVEKSDIRLGKACIILGLLSLILYFLACFGLVVLGLGSRVLGEM